MTERVNYGLSLCFKVTLDDQTDLGSWTKCEGLSLEYEVQEVKEGGNNEYVHRWPGRTKFQNLKLTRPVDKDTQKVADWLASVASDPKRSTAEIAILDGGGGTIATWRLQGIYPVRWSGPTLDTGTSTVALEVLELVHNGFAR
ncbi:MAG: phage tail protein [Chloroflexi bacterium]|nr:phage tail protein [Chloroflexota bacterium]